mmetsp:Transcript_28985/g.72587  ORF Transcript_28985/g.72587 Transcript_28985/m.72587 type:complete len:440 (-) Transcript_28985:575-1894(-)
MRSVAWAAGCLLFIFTSPLGIVQTLHNGNQGEPGLHHESQSHTHADSLPTSHTPHVHQDSDHFDKHPHDNNYHYCEHHAQDDGMKYEYGSTRDLDHIHLHEVGENNSTRDVWYGAIASTMVVSLASLICLSMLPATYALTGSIRHPPAWAVDGMTAFSAAAMLADAFLHQLPHAFSSNHGHGVGLAVVGGIMLFFIVEKILRLTAAGAHGHGHAHGASRIKLKEQETTEDRNHVMEPHGAAQPHASKNGLKQRSVAGNPDGSQPCAAVCVETGQGEASTQRKLILAHLNLIADGVHNFTDGMAIAAAFLQGGPSLGWARATIILVHELPQEIGDYGMLLGAGMSSIRALAWNFISALTALLGTVLVLALGADSAGASQNSGVLEGFIAGGFIYISLAGVLAEMAASTELLRTAWQVVCMGTGVWMCHLIHGQSNCDHSH